MGCWSPSYGTYPYNAQALWYFLNFLDWTQIWLKPFSNIFPCVSMSFGTVIGTEFREAVRHTATLQVATSIRKKSGISTRTLLPNCSYLGSRFNKHVYQHWRPEFGVPLLCLFAFGKQLSTCPLLIVFCELAILATETWSRWSRGSENESLQGAKEYIDIYHDDMWHIRDI